MASPQTNPLLACIDQGVALDDPHVAVYFAQDGERVDFATEQGGWSPYARAQAMAALETWAAPSGLSFEEVFDPAEADFRLVKSDAGGASLGFMNGPDPAYGDAQGVGWFNSGPYWSGAKGGMLSPGAYMFTIFLHEFGHGLGLAHPHDAGGSTVMPQVGEGLGLDQGVYTVMTYNDGWPEAPEGLPESREWGWNLGPSALDIAVVQAKYGANLETGAGTDRYRLPSKNEAGTGYLTIWDAGGDDDLIFHKGRRDAVIDLRAATLEPEEGGAGWVSRAQGVHGGFTLAHGVEIERAFGGRGDDRLTGNAVDNVLKGKTGADRLVGGEGDDLLLGGKGADRLFGGQGDDRLKAGPGRDRLTGGEGADLFAIRPGDGRAVILDFGAGDRLDLRGFGYADFDALEADLIDRGGRTVLKAAGATLALKDLSPEEIVEEMLLL